MSIWLTLNHTAYVQHTIHMYKSQQNRMYNSNLTLNFSIHSKTTKQGPYYYLIHKATIFSVVSLWHA